MDGSSRLIALERETRALRRRVHVLELKLGVVPEPVSQPRVAAGSAVVEQASSPPPPPPESAPPAPRAERRPVNWEDLLGGRVLAWIGGLAIAIGVALLFALAISQGWIGPTVRVALAGAGSSALLALGVWLHERRGRTDAARAAAASAIAALFGTATVAARVYLLIPTGAGLAAAVAIGAVAVALALRWDSRGIAALGIVGGLLAPVMLDAPSDLPTLMVLFVTAAAAGCVVVWRRWEWLALGAFAVTTPQWVYALFSFESRAVIVAVLVAFGVLGVAMAIGFDLRRSTDRLRTPSVFLLALNAIAVGLSGYVALESLGHPFMAKAWLAALSVAHIGAGILGTRVKRASHDLVLVALALGVALGDVAFGLLASGVVLAIGWAALGALFAWVARRTTREHDSLVALAGVGGHLTLAMIRAFAVSLEPGASGGVDALAAIIGVAALAAGCFVSARLAEERWVEWRVVLDVGGLVSLAYLSSIALDGGNLVLAWAAEALALAQIAHGTRDRVALAGAAGFFGLALAEALVVTPPRVLIYGLDDPLPQIAALAAVAVTAARFAQLRLGGGRWPLAGIAGACVSLLYLASGALMTGFQPDASTATTATILDVSIRQQGQMLMSALWAVTGIAALAVGLRSDLQLVRYGALGLILLATAKVFLFDLAALSSLYRVASFLALGLLLLVGAFIWQRTRPRPLPDLRSVS
jgi:uncharacterized membrane protein